jgi:hypothetical protein
LDNSGSKYAARANYDARACIILCTYSYNYVPFQRFWYKNVTVTSYPDFASPLNFYRFRYGFVSKAFETVKGLSLERGNHECDPCIEKNREAPGPRQMVKVTCAVRLFILQGISE